MNVITIIQNTTLKTITDGTLIKIWWNHVDGEIVAAYGKVKAIEGNRVLVYFGFDSCGHYFENDYLYTANNNIEIVSENEIKKLFNKIGKIYNQ